MNVNQREHALQKYLKMRDQMHKSDIAKDDNKYQEQYQLQNSCTLSVDPEQSRLVGIPCCSLKIFFWGIKITGLHIASSVN